MTLLQARGLTVCAGRQLICREVDLEINAGERWGILGGNGVGKTMLLHTLAGLRKPAAGRVLLDGIELSRYRRSRLARKIGVMLQDSQDLFPATVMETALMGRHPHHSFWSLEKREDLILAQQALGRLRLLELQGRRADAMSGGERRRLAGAVLFLQDPSLWLLDEPTNHLDLHHQVLLLDLISRRVDQRRGALVMALHDVNLVSRYCSHALLMPGAGQLLQGSVAAVINRKNLEMLYQHPVMELAGGGRSFYLPA